MKQLEPWERVLYQVQGNIPKKIRRLKTSSQFLRPAFISALEVPDSNQEVLAVRQKLRDNGVNVHYRTIKRGLISPSERGLEECMSQLPDNTTRSLLSHPEAWLGDVYRKYRLAEQALQRANERMIIQSEMEAKKAAAKLEGDGKKKKKMKRRKVRKGKSKVKSTAVT